MPDPQPIFFIDATLVHAPEVVALVESAYRGPASRAGWTTEDDLLDGQRTDDQEVGEIICGVKSRIRLAYLNHVLVGCVRIDHAGDAGYIGMVSVRPTMQSGGIGRRILQEAERVIGDELHLPRARMTVIGQRETLIAWYQRRGYLVTGKREPFPYGQLRSGLPKRDDLYFEILEKNIQRSPAQ